jgi:FkbM family methyltransferase
MTETPPHPAFARFQPWRGVVERGYQTNFLGVQTPISYFEGMAEEPRGEIVTTYPDANEEIFEWIDVLESVTGSDGVFTMIELGAGYGRWLANAAAACHAIGRDYRLVGVEAEPTHFDWMREHLAHNGIDPTRTHLVCAAVAGRDGKAKFRVGAPGKCYGQRIVRSKDEIRDWRTNWRGETRHVPAVSLTSLFEEAGLTTVDLIDLDVQSAEADVLEPAAELLARRVRRVHIGTHDPRSNEDRLRALFRGLGWECSYDFAFNSETATPFGHVLFGDGVQSWRNPHL